MAYPLSEILNALKSTVESVYEDRIIAHLSFDSRRIFSPENTLFFALVGLRDGHDFLDEAHASGVRCFVVEKNHPIPSLEQSLIIRMDDTLEALQKLCAYHRKQLHFPILGITGSNGKTVVKEWLFHLLQGELSIGRSPKSYNSQIGLPLSVWQLSKDLQLGLIEAGISEKGEMAALEEILKPDLGLITGIGAAHDDGFKNRKQKVEEKLSLFEESKLIIYPYDYELIRDSIAERFQHSDKKILGWSLEGKGDLQFEVREENQGTAIRHDGHTYLIPYKDRASIENVCSCLAFLWAIDHSTEQLEARLLHLPKIEMRLQMLTGQFGSSLINDAYSADISSLEIALQFMQKQGEGLKKNLIISSLSDGTGLSEEELNRLKQLFHAYKVDKLITVGKDYFVQSFDWGIPNTSFESTAQLLSAMDPKWFGGEMVLIKGRREFAFEKVVQRLEERVHETVLEINLNALENNFRYYKTLLPPEVKIMAMVKAQGYGSGSVEIARQLQNAGTDYLAVAYTDEGIQLRRSGISLPIMVMNASRASLYECVDYELEPVIYDFDIFQDLQEMLYSSGLTYARVHLEANTGMNRLGFSTDDLEEIVNRIQKEERIGIASVFTHLAAADEKEHDAFTMKQLERFRELKDSLEQMGVNPLFHALNTAGIERFSQYAFDMVRPGIGLYGISVASEQNPGLTPIATLKARINQIKELKPGETVGYSRKGIMPKGGKMGVVSIGYADGFPRNLSNGRGKVMINGKLAPIIGNVCMDMLMVDLNNIDCKTGDSVEIFGEQLPIEWLAGWADTIPYEIITGISSRVNRVYFRE